MSTEQSTTIPKACGTLEQRRGHWYVRISLPDGTRPRYRLPDSMSEAKRRDMALAISERERARVEAEMRLTHVERLTVRQFGELWTSGDLYRRHGEVKGLRPKKSASDDGWRLGRYVYPLIGHLAVADVTELDVERVMADVPRRFREKNGREIRQATKFQLYQALRRLFDLAIKPGRLRKDSPVSSDLRPSKDKPKLFGYLYPAELLALLQCESIPVARRVLYALATYTGLRLGSLYALRWGGVDFVNGTLTSLESKTGLPQMFEVDRGLLGLLQLWFEHSGSPAGDNSIVSDIGCEHGREAAALRADLHAAGIERALLFGGADNVQPIRFHDLRATFTTWALRQGRGRFWIMDRTGHITDEQMARYARQARTLADLRIEPFPDISEAIPELTELPPNVRRVRFSG